MPKVFKILIVRRLKVYFLRKFLPLVYFISHFLSSDPPEINFPQPDNHVACFYVL